MLQKTHLQSQERNTWAKIPTGDFRQSTKISAGKRREVGNVMTTSIEVVTFAVVAR